MERKIILEQVSVDGTWTTNLPLNEYHKAYIEYMKLCDVLPSKRLKNKFIIIPSFKTENLIIGIYFSSENSNADSSDAYIPALLSYMKDPKKFHDVLVDLKAKEDKLSQRAYGSDDEEALEDDDTAAHPERSRVYDLTGYEVPNTSPRKSSVASALQNPIYSTRGSFSQVSSTNDLTDLECKLRLVYLMNEEYFSNFHELEHLSQFRFQVFESVNQKLSTNVDWKNHVTNALKKNGKSVELI